MTHCLRAVIRVCGNAVVPYYLMMKSFSVMQMCPYKVFVAYWFCNVAHYCTVQCYDEILLGEINLVRTFIHIPQFTELGAV